MSDTVIKAENFGKKYLEGVVPDHQTSAGRITIKGRVASLLEVGTGFHPELTGREIFYFRGHGDPVNTYT
jgi:ABC-type polysaccharide/polyol phosphate transport system ATPase subunit